MLPHARRRLLWRLGQRESRAGEQGMRAGQASRAGEQGRRRAQDKGGNREYLQELIRFVVVVANPDDDVEELVCRLREKALSAGTVSFRGRAAEETQRER